jgi:GT2 family glycosyltransferase
MKNKETMAIGWCDNGMVDSLFVDGLIEVLSCLPKLNIQSGGTFHSIGNQISVQRQEIVDAWYKSDADWLLWVDSDVVVTQDIVKKLWESADKEKSPVVCGIYFVSTSPNMPLMNSLPCILRINENEQFEYIHPLPEDQIIPIDAAGMGLTLMHKSVIDKIKDIYDGIYFDTSLSKTGGKGEDISFFIKLKEQGIPVYAHTGCLAQHIKRFVFDHNYYNLWWNIAMQQSNNMEQ